MHKNFSSLLVAIVLILAWLGYQPGTTGVLHFDDLPNLGNLESATTRLLLIDFIFSGQAGPTGRPISLLTFALQQHLWPSGLRAMLQTNIAIHLLAGVAVYMLALGLARAVGVTSKHSPFVALTTASLWIFSPFLISAQLMLIQRMTTLSGLFVFSGLAAYVWGRLLATERPRLAQLLVWLGLIPFAILATLSKENGALLLPLALAIEHTLLKGTRHIPPPERAPQILLWAATLTILAYLLSLFPILWTQGWRPFTPWQRILSQPPILLDYLSNLLLPRSSAIAPYTSWNSAIPSISDARFLISLGVLLTIAAIAWRVRARFSSLWFALVFFFIAHLSESSITYLELYFAHRNYVPAFGLYFLISVAAIHHMPINSRLVGLAIGSYIVTFWGVLCLTTSLWGQPLLAAEIWAKNFPNSIRAQHALANQYTEAGDYAMATRLLDDLEGLAGNPGLYRVQPLLFCIHDPVEVRQRISDAAQRFATGPAVRGAGETVELLTSKALSGECPGLTPNLTEILADAILDGRTYANNQSVRAKALRSKALLAGERGNIDSMLQFLDLAFKEARALDLGFFYVSVLVTKSRFSEAMQYLDTLEQAAPRTPLKRLLWIERVRDWRALVTDAKTSPKPKP